MGRGSSKAGSRAGKTQPLPREVTEVTSFQGKKITLDSPLVYGDQDPIYRAMGFDHYIKENVEDVIADRPTERSWYWDSYGESTGTFISGNATSARTSFTREQAQSVIGMTHNHPRAEAYEAEVMGGTFSARTGNRKGDMANFCNTDFPNYTTMRAVAAEGTYSISKRSNFRRSLGAQYTKASNRNYESAFAGFGEDRRLRAIGQITDSEFYSRKARRMNNWLIADHNWLLANQDKYGYTYSLERR